MTKTITEIIKIDNHEIKVTNPQKIIYPKDHLIKKDIINYYQKIAPIILPHLIDRPISMQRFPDGIKGENFYQKEEPEYFPSWMGSKTINLHEGHKQHMVFVKNTADLVYLANQTVLPLHTWLSCVNHINNPDKIVFDLDPTRANDYADLRFAAQKIREHLETLKLNVFIMTSGAHGFHIVVPIKPTKDFDKVRGFCQKVAENLAKKYPKQLTNKVRKNKRRGRVFVDYLRNSFGATSICPYSLRAEDGAPIATPIRWNELGKTNPQSFNLKNIFKRLSSIGDPWKNIYKKAKSL